MYFDTNFDTYFSTHSDAPFAVEGYPSATNKGLFVFFIVMFVIFVLKVTDYLKIAGITVLIMVMFNFLIGDNDDKKDQ